jgi:CBS domain containing-hemolysin-like protein
LENVLDFRERDASQVMTPRTRVVGLPVDLTMAETLEAICTSRHSRYPVYDEDLDHIFGVLHTKDMARYIVKLNHQQNNKEVNETFELRTMVREMMFVPESLSLEKVLSQFREERTQIAAVVDEYGGVSGIVTLEDMAEELVGEIQDEHDQELPPFEMLEGSVLRVRGDLLLDELEQHFDLELAYEDTDTVGGLVMALLGHVAEPEESVIHEGITFIVESIEGLAIETILIQLPR